MYSRAKTDTESQHHVLDSVVPHPEDCDSVKSDVSATPATQVLGWTPKAYRVHPEDLPPIDAQENPTPRNVVLLFDGTGNQFTQEYTNLVKLMSVLQNDANQLVYYGTGVGEWCRSLN
jgi:hypothetical protein